MMGTLLMPVLQRRVIETTACVDLATSLNSSMPHFPSVTITVIIIPMPQRYYED